MNLEILIGVGFSLLPFLIPFLLSGVGVWMEKKHEEDLDRREAAVDGFLLTDISLLPSTAVAQGQLVSGNVVLGTGYLKQFFASFRTLFGGEIKSFQRVLERARREAQLRMIESAKGHGATAIVNVRFETSDVGGAKPFSEVMCYGTMIR